MDRQKRLRVGNEWYRVDLPFFHRRLRCLVIIDLKIGRFTHTDAGQMHLLPPIPSLESETRTMKYVPPSTGRSSFNCPHCHALAGQEWYILRAGKVEEVEQHIFVLTDAEEHDVVEFIVSNIPFLREEEYYEGYEFELHNASVSKCFSCKYISFWVSEKLIYPIIGNAPPPNSDLPDDIRRDYNEASSILDRSPRGAAALLRLAIQKLCKHLGQSGENINDDIAELVAGGLDPRIQKALDAIRVIGNNAVHPGHIDLKDDRETGETLFHLINAITDKMISNPKMIDKIYENLPEDVRNKIAKRDSKV